MINDEKERFSQQKYDKYYSIFNVDFNIETDYEKY